MTTDQIHEAAVRCGCTYAEMELCFSWMDDHGAPTEADYKKALDALQTEAAR